MEVHPPPSSPGELLDRARRGDLSALSQLVERFRLEFVRTVRTIVGSGARARVEAEDVVQDSVLTALRSIQDLRSSDLRGFRAWFLAIARHRVLVFQKHQRMRVRPRRQTPLPPSHLALQDPSDLEHMAPGAEASMVEENTAPAEFEAVKPDHRVSVVLHEIFDSSWDTSAFLLNRPTREAARQVHLRARMAFGQPVA
jgi:DNA-directed RNA polymerase specialized sigma24 family protein